MKKKIVTFISIFITCFFWQANSQSKPVIKCSENIDIQINVGKRTATVTSEIGKIKNRIELTLILFFYHCFHLCFHPCFYSCLFQYFLF